ncbi:MAG: rod shape-determining protein MreC [Acidobacteria bacterium]|nr:rod shape-determining protein MreC [Acidobacteriota bacterium]
MRAFLGTQRHLPLLVAVLLAQLFLLAYQIKTENDVRLIRRWAVAVIAPVGKAVNAVQDTAGSFLRHYVALYDARQESERLRAELDQARLRLQELEARAADTEQLATLLEFKQSHAWAPLLAAQVIAASPAAATRTVLIDRGQAAGLKPNMAVLTPDGVVGKVMTVFPEAAQVLLITDRKSGVGVQVAGSELLGVLNGTGGPLCALEYVPNEETVAVGATLLTSGQDQIFPKGLPVGRVLSVGRGESFQEIVVQPAARLTRLEHVLVLAGPPEALATTAQAPESRRQLSR